MSARVSHRVIGALGLCALLASPAWASPHRLDDSQSHAVPPTVQIQWRPIAPGQGDTGMEAWVRVNVRIATRAWLGRSGRIYMVLPRDQSSSIEAVWTTNGPLRSGRLVSGERALVWAGTIGADLVRKAEAAIRTATT